MDDITIWTAASGVDKSDRAGLQNRVSPRGALVRSKLRCYFTGNRGILHHGTTLVRPYKSKLWITCALTYKDYRLPQWAEHHFTVLFSYDEAVALAAGHRPCALCRRDAYDNYLAAWMRATGRRGRPYARELDSILHAQRLFTRTRRRILTMPIEEVPTGAFFVKDSLCFLVYHDQVIEWNDGYGYTETLDRPQSGTVQVVTPLASILALRAGYSVDIRLPDANEPRA